MSRIPFTRRWRNPPAFSFWAGMTGLPLQTFHSPGGLPKR